MQADLSRRRSSSTEEAEAKAAPKAPSVGTSYAVKQAGSFGDTTSVKSVEGFTPKLADTINSKQKTDSMRKLPSAF
jgi:hypothetical protein